MKKILLLFTCLILLVGCGKESDSEKFKEEYESLNGQTTSSGNSYLNVTIDKNNVIKYASIEEIIDIIDNKTGVIYLGYPECPWCRNIVSPLLEAADSTSIDTIYYLNMHDIRDKKSLDSDGNVITEEEGNDKYKDLLNSLDSILEEYILTDSNGNEVKTGEKRIYVPLVVFVKDGEIVGYHANTVESQTDPYTPLTEEEKEELINIYKENIKLITSDSCDNEGRC